MLPNCWIVGGYCPGIPQYLSLWLLIQFPFPQGPIDSLYEQYTHEIILGGIESLLSFYT